LHKIGARLSISCTGFFNPHPASSTPPLPCSDDLG
jgi:arylsulfatase A-like enzyme